MAKVILILASLLFYLPADGFAEEFEAILLERPKPAQQPAKAQPLLSTMPTGDADSDCVDDPRLETEIVEIMQSDNPVIVPPITVTPETYLNLDGDVLAKLAGSLVICPKNPVLKNGKTVRKISVDFPVLWEHILNAVKTGNQDRLNALLHNFISKPMNPKDIFRLNTTIALDREKLNMLYDAAGTTRAGFEDVIDFYVFTGGKSAEKAAVFIGDNMKAFGNKIEEEKKEGKAIYTWNLPDQKGNYGYRNYIRDRLKAAGLDAFSQ